MVDIEMVDIKAAATSILRPVIGDLRSPSLRENLRRRLLLPGRCRRIFSDPYELDIVVERTPRRPITIPRKHNGSPKLHPSGPIENSVIRDFRQRDEFAKTPPPDRPSAGHPKASFARLDPTLTRGRDKRVCGASRSAILPLSPYWLLNRFCGIPAAENRKSLEASSW